MKFLALVNQPALLPPALLESFGAGIVDRDDWCRRVPAAWMLVRRERVTTPPSSSPSDSTVASWTETSIMTLDSKFCTPLGGGMTLVD